MVKAVWAAVAMAAAFAVPAWAQERSSAAGDQGVAQILGQILGQQGGQNEDQAVKKLLEQRGYTDVGQVTRQYRTTATRDGKEVALIIDADSGSIRRDSQAPQTTQARREAIGNERALRDLLNDEGYTRVSNIRKSGDRFRADAEKDGEQLSLVIDAETGDINERQR